MAYDFIDCIGDDVDVVSDSEVCETFSKIHYCLLFFYNIHTTGVTVFFMFLFFFVLLLEHQEAFENSLQQIPC